MAKRTAVKQTKIGWYDGVPMPLDRLAREIERGPLATNLKKDEDGDWPVEVILVDRTQCRSMHYQPVPYTHDRSAGIEALAEAGVEALEEAERVAETNLAIAMDEWRKIRREVREVRDKARRAEAFHA